MSNYVLHQGDCLEVLRTMPDNGVDAIVTDPPYGLSFMGKKWDYDVPAVEVWREALRILKPGGYLVSFGGTRTFHRLACRIEDAGFLLHPMLGWIFGSGFPKATRVDHPGWEGWRYGLQSLKPAFEPIALAQKPFSEDTGTANILRWGTGALNIDGCRVAPTGESRARLDEASQYRRYANNGGTNFAATPGVRGGDPSGRWPANLIHDGSEDVLAIFPNTPGQLAKASTSDTQRAGQNAYGAMARGSNGQEPRGDAGSAARFFYCAKASKRDRDEGLESHEAKMMGFSNGAQLHEEGYDKGQGIGLNRVVARKNNHPTVKPTDLMRYLCRLVTPPGGTVLDPFMGSGSTGKAAMLEGFRFIGCELSPEYLEIAEARIADALAEIERVYKVAAESASPQLSIFDVDAE